MPRREIITCATTIVAEARVLNSTKVVVCDHYTHFLLVKKKSA